MAVGADSGGRAARARRTLQQRLALVRMLGDASPWLVVAATVAAVIAGLLPVAVIIASGLLSGRIDDAVRHGGADAPLGPVYAALLLVAVDSFGFHPSRARRSLRPICA